MGIDHAELGMECADQWGLPGDIAEAIGNHHESELDSPLAACAVASNLLANHWDLTGFSVLSPDAIDQLLEKLSGFGATVDSDLLLQWLEASRLSYQDVIGTLG